LKLITITKEKSKDIDAEGAKINSKKDKQSNNGEEDILNDNVNDIDIKEININMKSLNKEINHKISQKYNNDNESKELFLKSLNTNTIYIINNINIDSIKYDNNDPEERIYEYTKDNELYIYKYTYRNSIKRLRCYDINYKGSAKLIENGSIEIINNYDIQYNNNNYRKKEIIWYKIKNNLEHMKK